MKNGEPIDNIIQSNTKPVKIVNIDNCEETRRQKHDCNSCGPVDENNHQNIHKYFNNILSSEWNFDRNMIRDYIQKLINCHNHRIIDEECYSYFNIICISLLNFLDKIENIKKYIYYKFCRAVDETEIFTYYSYFHEFNKCVVDMNKLMLQDNVANNPISRDYLQKAYHDYIGHIIQLNKIDFLLYVMQSSLESYCDSLNLHTVSFSIFLQYHYDSFRSSNYTLTSYQSSRIKYIINAKICILISETYVRNYLCAKINKITIPDIPDVTVAANLIISQHNILNKAYNDRVRERDSVRERDRDSVRVRDSDRVRDRDRRSDDHVRRRSPSHDRRGEGYMRSSREIPREKDRQHSGPPREVRREGDMRWSHVIPRERDRQQSGPPREGDMQQYRPYRDSAETLELVKKNLDDAKKKSMHLIHLISKEEAARFLSADVTTDVEDAARFLSTDVTKDVEDGEVVDGEVEDDKDIDTIYNAAKKNEANVDTIIIAKKPNICDFNDALAAMALATRTLDRCSDEYGVELYKNNFINDTTCALKFMNAICNARLDYTHSTDDKICEISHTSLEYAIATYYISNMIQYTGAIFFAKAALFRNYIRNLDVALMDAAMGPVAASGRAGDMGGGMHTHNDIMKTKYLKYVHKNKSIVSTLNTF
jgi:hypothetical protein